MKFLLALGMTMLTAMFLFWLTGYFSIAALTGLIGGWSFARHYHHDA